MGQHKYNPTAIAAKNGELPEKKKPMGKRQSERLLHAMMLAKMEEDAPGLLKIMDSLHATEYMK